MNNKKSVLFIIVLLVCMFLSIAIILVYNRSIPDKDVDVVDKPTSNDKKDNKKNDEEQENDYLKQHEIYFSIYNTINDIINEFTMHDYNYLTNSLLVNYINENGINSGNVTNYIFFDSSSIYSISEIKQYKLNDRVVKYFVSGYIKKIDLENTNSDTMYKLTIYYDNENKTFGIVPNEFANYDVKQIDDLITNKYNKSTGSEQQIAMLYYSDLQDKIKRNDDNLDNIIKNYKSFIDSDKKLNSDIASYRISDDESNILIHCSDGTNLNFKLEGVLQYKVTIN